MKRALFLLFFLTSAGWAAEPSIKLRMDVSPREFTIGDPVQCNITVIFSSALRATPLLPAVTGEFELLNVRPPEVKTLPNGDTQMTHSLLLTTFSTGTLTLAPFVLNFMTQDGQRVEAKTQPLDLTVISLLEKHGDEGNLRPLKGLFNFRSYFWLWVGLLVVAIAAFAYFGFRSWKKKRLAHIEALGPQQPPEETAWEALQKLEDSDLLANGHVKEFYVQLSVILRTYLEGRYDISGLDRTTSELLAEIRRLDLSHDTTTALRIFIDNSDLVKFAKYTPLDEEIRDDLSRVKQFFTQTTPRQAPQPEAVPV